MKVQKPIHKKRIIQQWKDFNEIEPVQKVERELNVQSSILILNKLNLKFKKQSIELKVQKIMNWTWGLQKTNQLNLRFKVSKQTQRKVQKTINWT